MIDYSTELVEALKTILPTHFEMKLTSKTPTPCISYLLLTNIDKETGDTIGYSEIIFQVKVWGNDLAEINKYAKEIDKKLRPIGFTRIGGGGELYDTQSTLIQKPMSYRATGLENY